ncbi:type I polyketide synthase [Thermobifida alba]|uniref:Type I polyketide synthase n=1 Tax=Thermobifida alba TaxID=53522 RepID=A0ABY4L6A6_THEAE|nr:type I polyketide synthase [Thermobifida alba]UPT23220.1 type I polyketide synthase [Thermobifida alba]
MVNALSPEHRRLLAGALRKVQEAERLREEAEHALQQQRNGISEPVAVLGMGLRLPPDVESPEELWSLLVEGREAVGWIGPNPDGRRGGHHRWRRAARLDEIDSFDSAFFGMTPDEADRLDPQQRLVLEASWEALEDAGLPADRLRGSATGVYMGIYNNDYLLSLARNDVEPDVYTAPGVAHSIVANRLSYLLDLSGPSLAVDTACSSSLTAVHLAVRALRAGDCDYAIAGGVNAIVDPYSTRLTERVLPLAPGGRCLSYEEGAEGIVRGEGCGILILARESDARRQGLPIRALIRGSAVNHDGRTNGLTAPNPRAQAAVLARALRDAGLDGSDIDYVEGHGTGTPLGDPLEMEALEEVYGTGPGPCLLGSVKRHIGHLEAAAGVAGMMKAILVLEHGTVPAQPGFTRLNPEIPPGDRLRVASEPTDLPDRGRPPRAAVSSFGFGGANAHVVIEHPGTLDRPPAPRWTGPLLLPLSARSPEALRQLRSSYADLLDGADEATARDVCAAAMNRRSHLPLRTADTAASVQELRDRLVAPRPPAEPAEEPPQVVLVFSGQGSQWPGMGAELLALPDTAEELEACDAAVRKITGHPLIDLLSDEEELLEQTGPAQMAVAAVQLALTSWLRRRGVHPTAVIGHSMGELPAAVAAGALTREEMFTVLDRRAQVMDAARGGRMISVALDEEQAAAWAARYDRVGVAAVNGPASTVLAGPRGPIEEIRARLRDEGVRCIPLPVDYAFHSPLLDGSDTLLEAALADLPARTVDLDFHSTVTGRPVERLDARYWARNLRAPVRFADAVASLGDVATSVVIECAPHTVLSTDLQRTFDDRGVRPRVPPVATMRRGTSAAATLTGALAHLYEAGCDIDWTRVARPARNRVALPTYPWQRRRHWFTPSADQNTGQAPEQTGQEAAPVRLDRAELLGVLRGWLADAVEVPVEQVDPAAPLTDWDIESLVVVEIRNRLERRYGTEFPLAAFFEAGSLYALAEELAGGGGQEEQETAPDDAELDQLLDRMDEMSDAEIELAIARLEGTE